MSLVVTKEQKQALTVATIISLIVGILFLRHYISLFIVASILVYLFHPVYRRFGKRFSQNAAASLTLLTVVLSIVIPLVLIIIVSVGQLKNVSSGIASTVSSLNADDLGQQAVDIINNLLDTIPFVDITVTQESLIESIKNIFANSGDWLFDYLTGIITSIPSLITTAIIFIFVFFSLIKNSPKLIEMVTELNPLGGEMTELYMNKIGAMVRGTVQGQFIIAATQGLLAAATFALVGYADMFFVLFLIFTLLSIIPLGAGILIIPLGVVMALFGNVWPGIIVVAEHLLINTNIDNVLRPILVPKEAKLDSALMLVSVFAGLGFFGFLGIIIGPTLMIVIVTTISVYLEVHKGYKKTVEEKKSNPHLGKLKKIFQKG